MFADRLADVIETRAYRPELVAEAAVRRPRAPSFLSSGGTLVLVAADHPARGTLRAGRLMTAMADRTSLLERLCVALARPGVDGVLGSADVLEDLLLLGALDGKVVIGSMNRGGLADTVFEIDDRFTGYDAPAIARMAFDGGKMLLRIDPDDPATAATLQACAHAVSDLAARRLVAMIEPFISHRVEGRVRNDLSPEAMMRAIAIASGLGTTSAYTWLKVPVVPDMERVMAASTLPALLLGGEVLDDPQSAYAGWRKALRLPNVKGLVAGRSLLYPADDDVATAVDTAVSLLLSGGPVADLGQPDAEAGGGELEQHRAGRHQGCDLGRAELLQLGQDLGVGVRAVAAVGERDVPPFNPLGVDEAATLEFLGDRDRGALVGRVEVPARVAGGLQRLKQGGHPADQLLDHPGHYG
jgi:hypothetical protein